MNGAALSWMQVAARIALAAFAVLFAGCASTQSRAVFEVGEVVPAGTASAVAVPHRDPLIPVTHVVGIRQFRVESASVQPDSLGYPAVAFDLVAEDHKTFRAYTAALIGRVMAAMIDGEVVTIATVASELPGVGILSFGLPPPPPDELKQIAERLAPPK